MKRPLSVDDALIAALSESLREQHFTQGGNFGRALPAVLASITEIWEYAGDRPTLTVVFGAAFNMIGQYTKVCGARHPLVFAGLADAGDKIDGDGFYMAQVCLHESEQSVAILFNAKLPHSQIRWRSANGDRIIVVLPPEYDER